MVEVDSCELDRARASAGCECGVMSFWRFSSSLCCPTVCQLVVVREQYVLWRMWHNLSSIEALEGAEMRCGFRRKVALLRRGICDSYGKVEVTQDRD